MRTAQRAAGTAAARAAVSPKGFPRVRAGAEVLGEIVSWDVSGVKARYRQVLDALEDAGLGGAYAREMTPRSAFLRAIRTLAENRVIRRVSEDETELRFQFTAERRDGDGLAYDREDILRLCKETGDISGGVPALVGAARAAFDEALDRRTTADITRMIQRFFEDRGRVQRDLIPIRPQGGCYFVRRSEIGHVAKVAGFVAALGGVFLRMPLAAGAEGGLGEKAVAHAVREKMAALIAELDDAINGFDAETSGRKLEAAAERVRTTRFKVESYAEYLLGQHGGLLASLGDAEHRLAEKVRAIAAGTCYAARGEPENEPPVVVQDK